MPGWGKGVTVPISMKPKPKQANSSINSPFLSKPAASPTGLSNSIPNAFTFNDFLLGQDTLVSSSSFLIEGPHEYESYEWNIPGEMNAALLISESGTYVLETTDINGCVYSDEIKIVFEVPNNESYIEVPDVFYFGNGGLVAKYKNVDVYDVKVFDDIGRLVSYGNTFPLIWDGAVNGNETSSAMYFYVINYNDINGGKKVHKGNSLMIK